MSEPDRESDREFVTDEIRQEIRHEIARILVETESSTLALGDNLGAIVRGAEDYVRAIRERMGALDGGPHGGVTSVLDEQCSAVDHFVDEMSGAVDAQARVADQVIETSRTVAGAAQAVAQISMQSRMLCLNTMIEAGRLGELGRPFMVIGDQMRELSEGIARSNQLISKLAADLVPLLDDVKSNIAGLRGRTDTFRGESREQRGRIQEVTGELQRTAASSLTLGDDKLESIIQRSNAALVNMQMQDIVAQRLRRILKLTSDSDDVDADVDALLAVSAGSTASLAYLLRGGDGSADRNGRADAGGGLGAGEMELF